MLAGLKPYPGIKDSGLKWLGDVPEHWGVRRLRNATTHYCAKDRNGRFQLGRKPIAKRVTRILKRIKEALWRRRHRPKAETARWLGRVIDGWLNYYAVPTSFRWLDRFVHGVKRLWLRALRRRSQKDRHRWDALQRLVDTHWPSVTIRHPWPSQRLAVHTTQGRSRMP